MSIGALGSSGEQFRDFLGGNQQDIGSGLQAILGSYNNPLGNLSRLDQRTQGMFQLTNSEYLSVFNADAQNSFAKTWYQEYRAVLQLRADALTKKLNVAYTRVLERSMYAPVRPEEKWAPKANRDHNDIDAKDPTKLPGTLAAITPPTNVVPPPTGFLHPDWLDAGGANEVSDNPWDDLRTYINDQYPLPDADGDGRGPVTFNTGTNTYNTSGEQANPALYDLWAEGVMDLTQVKTFTGESAIRDTDPFPFGDGPTTTEDWWKKNIAVDMNVPPSVDTSGFILTGGGNNEYYARIPDGNDTRDFVANGLTGTLPTIVTAAMNANGTFSLANKNTLAGSNLNWQHINGPLSIPASPAPVPAADPGSLWVLEGGTRFYDPRQNINQSMFGAGSYAGPTGGANAGITINNNLAIPPKPVGVPGGASPTAAADLADMTTMPVYQQDFVDSWIEARALQKREAQVEAAHQAYIDGDALIQANPSTKGMSYRKVMDQVFTGLDQLNPGPITPGISNPISGPSSTTFPSNMPPSVDIDITGVMPYGAHIINKGGGTFDVVGTADPFYDHGRDFGTAYAPSTTLYDQSSIYGMVYERLKFVGQDPGTTPGGSTVSGAVPPPPPAAAPAGTYGIVPGTVNSGNSKLNGGVPTTDESNLMTPIPVGAAENQDNSTPNIGLSDGVKNLNDTFFEIPPSAQDVDNISRLFVGRQWDVVPGANPDNPTAHLAQGKGATAGLGAVHYDADTISAHMMALPGWYGGTLDHAPGSTSDVLLTMSPPIEGYALQSVANATHYGTIDDVTNRLLGGPFLRVGGGSDAAGPFDLDNDETKYNIGAGFGMGALGMFWGHTSAVGRIGDVETLMTDPGPLWNTFTASIKGLAAIGGGSGDDMSIFPNVGMVGTNIDFNIPIPIPIPFVGLYWLNIPMTTYGGMSWDIVTDYMSQFLDSMRNEVLDSVSVFSYASSGGYAMDSYGMRGEYHFTEKTAFSALQRMPEMLGLDFGGFADQIIDSALGGSESWDGDINQAALKERLMQENGNNSSGVRHSYSAGEARELDTGAFFSTAAFLSQFQSAGTDPAVDPGLEYSYWTQTQHNEEVANMDMMRMLLLSGKDIMLFLSKALFASAGAVPVDNTYAVITLQIMNFFIEGMKESVNEAVIWDLLLHDQSQEGYVTSSKIRASGLTSEGYDFIEDERKLFQNDYQANTSKGFISTLTDNLTGSFETPNQILNGFANTRRYKPYLSGPDGLAGRQGYGNANGVDGSKAHPLLYNPSQADTNWDIHTGFWNDTGLGDMNEVYVRKQTVSYGGTDHGIGSAAAAGTPDVSTEMNRYVGSHNRIFNRAYEGGTPINLQSFRTGYYADKYFGTDITAVNDIQTQTMAGVDGDPNAVYNMHGGQGYYDRKNDYAIAYKDLEGNVVNLDNQAALAPTLGGSMKIASIDQNDNTAQDLLLGKDTSGRLNELNKVIQEHLRLKDDGSNLKAIRDYRDVFNLDFLDDVFVSVSANSPIGGGLTSSIRVKFNQEDPFDDTTGMIGAPSLGALETELYNQVGGTRNIYDKTTGAVTGTQNLLVHPGYLGRESLFKNSSKGRVDVYLNSYFAFRRAPETGAK